MAQGHSLLSALTSGYQLGSSIAAACVATGLLIVVVVLRSPGATNVRQSFTRADRPSTEEVEAA